MKKILSTFLWICAMPTIGFTQATSFGKFLGSNSPNKFAGNATFRGYEKQVELIEVVTNGQAKNTTIIFKFSPCAASADFLAHTQLAYTISKGQIDVMEKSLNNPGTSRIKYKIYFEDAIVNSCTDTQTCNNTMATTVTLRPQRICWIYYNYEPTSLKLAGTSTNGFDLKSGQPWTVTPPNF